jgi:multiple sugar transport system substrate-binding protein
MNNCLRTLRAALLPLAIMPALAAASAEAAAFSWRQAEGASIVVALNQHPYTDAIIERLPRFRELTGIRVEYSVTSEENYFDKITTSLFARNGNPDVFMTGVYQMWDYASAGYLEALDAFLADPALTGPDYDKDDILPPVLAGGRWDLRVGSPVGSGMQWVLPLGFEIYMLTYNKRVFAERGLKVPTTMAELEETARQLKGWNGPGSYGLAARGTRSWATIHPGYMTTFANAGARDFKIENGVLLSALDSPEAIAMTAQWARLMRESGPPAWSTYTWYQCCADLGAGKAAMSFDADIASYFQNVPGSSRESGNIGFAPPPAWRAGDPVGSNQWIWSLAINRSSRQKTAAWLFVQYFTGPEHTLWGALHAKVVDPPRQSIWSHPDFIKRLEAHSGYYAAFQAVLPNSRIQFTPQPYFFETTTQWAAALQRLVTGRDQPEKVMRDLAERISRRTQRIRQER